GAGAALSVPLGVAADGPGLLIADSADDCVRLLRVGGLPATPSSTASSPSATSPPGGHRSTPTLPTLSAPRRGYVVYWDQDEEVDYYASANRSQGQLMAPWDLNGQVCMLSDGTGRWVGGSDPTNPSQHNPGGPPNLPFKQPAVSEELNGVHGGFTGQTLSVPGPYRLAPGLPGEDSPPDSTGVYNGQATYTGCAVDAHHDVFASDIGTAQGSFPIPTDGRLVEWFAPTYTRSCILYGPTTGGVGADHDDGTGGLAQPGMMTAMGNGNILVPQAGSPSGGFPGDVLEFDHSSFPTGPGQCPGGVYPRSKIRHSVFVQGTTDNLPVPMGVARDPACRCYAVSSIFGGGTHHDVIEWFDSSGHPVARPGVPGETLADFGNDPHGFNPFGMAFAPDGTLYFIDIHIVCSGVLTNCGPEDFHGRLLRVTFGPGRVPSSPVTIADHFAFPTSATICVPTRQRCPFPLHPTPLPTPESPAEGE
ncbi:MAG: hypothetical protein ACYC0E_15080, partial [Acidimicrobiales bacterium]